MALQSFDRNYGMSKNSREFWGGDNGFVTLIVKLPTDVEIGATAVAQDGTDAAQTALSAAERNQFKLAQALAQRAVIVASSVTSAVADPTASGFETVGGNVLAFGKAGTTASGSFAITYLIERANVLSKQDNKPGATYALTVDPCKDLADILALPGFFQKKDGSDAAAAAGVAVKVYNALPAIIS